MRWAATTTLLILPLAVGCSRLLQTFGARMVTRVGLALIYLFLPSIVAAQQLDRDPLAMSMQTYYNAEKRGSLAYAIAGSTLLAAGGVMVAFDDPPELRAAAYPMLGFGLLELFVGAIPYARLDDHVAERNALLARDREAFVRAETATAHRVRRAFLGGQIINSVLTVGGLVTGIIGVRRDLSFGTGFGFGLAGSAAQTLSLDTWGMIRVRNYLDGIEAGRLQGSPLKFRW